MKFGGAVLKNKEGFRKMKEILSDVGTGSCLVVVSAFSKATSELRSAAKIAESGQAEEALNKIETIIDEYRLFAGEIIGSAESRTELEKIYSAGTARLQELINNLRNGDKVITSGGIYGTVVGVADRVVQLRIADGVKIDVGKHAIIGKQDQGEIT